jgi:peptidoglycan/LPS O-acetylase OafA/YrhL
MWIIIWGLSARVGTGPIWHTTNMNMQTCETTWLPTLLFVGNLFPVEMKPYEGCYQQAWPLQVDMQIALFIPFLAIIFFNSNFAGVILSILLICANIGINMYYTYQYGLTIGLLDHG